MQTYRGLKVWERSHALVLEIYRQSMGFPPEERFGLISQLRRAAVSVASNIAEGAKRRHRHDYARFLNVSEASLAETSYLVLLSRDLGLIEEQLAGKILSEVEEISRMLNALRRRVESRPDP